MTDSMRTAPDSDPYGRHGRMERRRVTFALCSLSAFLGAVAGIVVVLAAIAGL